MQQVPTAYGNAKRQIRAAAFVVLFALTVRIVLFAYYFGINPERFFDCGDSYEYIYYAKNLLDKGIIGNPPNVNIFRTPLFICFLAAVYFFTCNSNIAVVILQLVISSLTCGIVYLIASRYANKIAAITAALFLALDAVSVTLANKVLTETLFSFCVAVLVIVFIKFIENSNTKFLMLSGLVAGAATLIRPILFYFAAASIPVLGYYWGKTKKMAVYFLIFNFCFMAPILPWLYRNIKAGYWGIAAVQEYNIFMYKAGWIEEVLKGNPPPERINIEERIQIVYSTLESRGLQNTPANRVKIYKELGNKTVMSNPLLLAKYQSKYITEVFTSSGLDDMFEHFPDEKQNLNIKSIKKALIAANAVLLAAMYVTFLFGGLCSTIWDKNKGTFFIIILLLYFVFLSGELGGGARFRAPMMPLILVISAIGIEQAICKLNNAFRNIKE